MMSKTFEALGLPAAILKAVEAQNYTAPTPIQAQAIPPLLEGRDVLGCAQTGTGKTAAFSLPILARLSADKRRGKRKIRALVLSPTRELAAQIEENVETYARHLDIRHLVIFGGVSQKPQVEQLRRGIDMLVATPGRLLDLHGQGMLDLSAVEHVVLDEADRMLDMGFIHDIRRVFRAIPERRQSLLFSATMPAPIAKLAREFLNNPIRVEVDRESTTVKRIIQKVMFVERANKKKLLTSLLKDPIVDSAIVFTRTKHGANRVAHVLTRAGIQAAAIHGNKSQGARQRALSGFKDGQIRALIATDIASRGIDVDGVSHVFNYELPNVSESYVHRIGRTGRAGRDGIAIAFCDESETDYLVAIERLTGQPLEIIEDHQYHFEDAMPRQRVGDATPSKKKGRSANRRRGGKTRTAKSDTTKETTSATNESTETKPKSSGGDHERGRTNDQRRRRRRRRGRPSHPSGGTPPTQSKS
ncbi:MAG: DEAD/DEAH box helicase [Myxococcota bacterium]|nr:DEAD/DEAH box helicase [Myxococcota bacterium]